jgi:hypothetical protein
MIETKALQRAITVGVLLQVTMVVLGHYVGWIVLHVYAFGGMMISGTAGFLYAQDVGAGYGPSALCGLIAGTVCGIVELVLIVLLRDMLPFALAIGIAVSALTGVAGGLWGQLSANMRRAGW